MKPHPAAFDLVSGRHIKRLENPDSLVASAFEHRVAGLLWTRVLQGKLELSAEASMQLEDADMSSWARNQLLLQVANDVVRVAAQHSVGVVFIKGVTTERRWYDRTGERRSLDLDVVVEPSSLNRVPAMVAALYPKHPLLPAMESLIRHRSIQSVDLTHRGLHIDLHLDPLKQEIVWCRHADEIFARTFELEMAAGLILPVFDDSVSLLLAALHLNKDRFRYLIGYSDVARILARSNLDWDWIRDFLDREGLDVPIEETIHAVVDTLGIEDPGVGSSRRKVGRALWRAAWPPETRLWGDAGRVRLYYRQFLIPLLAPNRLSEAVGHMLRRLFPAPSLLRHYYPKERGPYLWKLVVGRIRLRWQRWMTRRHTPR